MQVVINLDNEIYEKLKNDAVKISGLRSGKTFTSKVYVANGVPIPKWHGRVVDADKLLEEMRATRTYDIPFALERVKPIIEADKTRGER